MRDKSSSMDTCNKEPSQDPYFASILNLLTKGINIDGSMFMNKFLIIINKVVIN